MTTIAKAVAWLALVGVGVLGGGGPLPAVAVSAVLVAGLIATVALGCTVVSIWRGPPVVAFAPEDGLRCGEEESEPVRAYAQLRGTIGGAGHVHPARLVFPAVAWGAALVAGARCLPWPALEVMGQWSVAVAVGAALGAWLLPARPYWYREVMGGGALVSPPDAVGALVAREMTEDGQGIAVVHEVGRASPILRECGAETRSSRAKPHAVSSKRAPRYAVHRSLVVERNGSEVEVATVNVSEGGLAVRWPGAPPVQGDDVIVKLQDGLFTRALDANVCWNSAGRTEREPMVGLKVWAEGRAGRIWRDLVEGAARSGAQVC